MTLSNFGPLGELQAAELPTLGLSVISPTGTSILSARHLPSALAVSGVSAVQRAS